MFFQLRLSTGWVGTLWINPQLNGYLLCKQRPVEKSFVDSDKKRLAFRFCGCGRKAENLTDEFWPGALTIVLPAKNNLPDFSERTRNTIAVRHSPSKLVDELLGILNKPLIGTSANLSGQPSCKTVDET